MSTVAAGSVAPADAATSERAAVEPAEDGVKVGLVDREGRGDDHGVAFSGAEEAAARVDQQVPARGGRDEPISQPHLPPGRVGGTRCPPPVPGPEAGRHHGTSPTIAWRFASDSEPRPPAGRRGGAPAPPIRRRPARRARQGISRRRGGSRHGYGPKIRDLRPPCRKPSATRAETTTADMGVKPALRPLPRTMRSGAKAVGGRAAVRSDPAEAGHHLVGDQQEAVAVAECREFGANSRPAARWPLPRLRSPARR